MWMPPSERRGSVENSFFFFPLLVLRNPCFSFYTLPFHCFQVDFFFSSMDNPCSPASKSSHLARICVLSTIPLRYQFSLCIYVTDQSVLHVLNNYGMSVLDEHQMLVCNEGKIYYMKTTAISTIVIQQRVQA